MNSVKIYPDDELMKALVDYSKDTSASLNTTVCDALREVFLSGVEEFVSEAELSKEIFEEIKQYVKDANDGDEFCLMEASKIYLNGQYLYEVAGSNFRAKFGKAFGKQVKENNVEFVEVALDKKGKRKLGKNNAVMYKVVKI